MILLTSRYGWRHVPLTVSSSFVPKIESLFSFTPKFSPSSVKQLRRQICIWNLRRHCRGGETSAGTWVRSPSWSLRNRGTVVVGTWARLWKKTNSIVIKVYT